MKPKIAVWKFASCDGCQLTLLDCEDELLDIVGAVDIAYFPEASRDMRPGPYDISFVEGSVTTSEEVERIGRVRAESGALISIGACATSGGIQALRNWADVEDFTQIVYAEPTYIDTLERSRPISDFVPVDLELRGCPISKRQLLEVISATLIGRTPVISTDPVCTECKLRGISCLMVSGGIPCLGPITQAGCDAVCPAVGRGCFGCYGPSDSANADSLVRWWQFLGVPAESTRLALRAFTGYAPEFREASERL